MASGDQVEKRALEALSQLLGDHAPRLLHGTKSAEGVFPGASAPEKAAAQLSINNGWLVPTGEFAGKGKTRKEHFRVTPSGVEAVLSRSDPSQLLRQLNDNLAKLQTGDLANVVRANFSGLEARIEDVRAELEKKLVEALRPLEAMHGISELRSQIGQLLERIKPIDVSAITRANENCTPPTTTISASLDLMSEIIRMISEHRQKQSFQRLTLAQVYERLRARHPDLTLGQFHDGLRRLHDERRIRLGPYTQALATIDDPRTALFLDREVKFYVDVT